MCVFISLLAFLSHGHLFKHSFYQEMHARTSFTHRTPQIANKIFGPVSFSLYLTPYTTNHFFFSFFITEKFLSIVQLPNWKCRRRRIAFEPTFYCRSLRVLETPVSHPSWNHNASVFKKVFYPPEISVRWGPPTFRTHEIIVQPLIFNANETLHQQLIGIPGSSKALFSPTYNPYPNLNRTKIPLPKP